MVTGWQSSINTARSLRILAESEFSQCTPACSVLRKTEIEKCFYFVADYFLFCSALISSACATWMHYHIHFTKFLKLRLWALMWDSLFCIICFPSNWTIIVGTRNWDTVLHELHNAAPGATTSTKVSTSYGLRLLTSKFISDCKEECNQIVGDLHSFDYWFCKAFVTISTRRMFPTSCNSWFHPPHSLPRRLAFDSNHSSLAMFANVQWTINRRLQTRRLQKGEVVNTDRFLIQTTLFFLFSTGLSVSNDSSFTSISKAQVLLSNRYVSPIHWHWYLWKGVGWALWGSGRIYGAHRRCAQKHVYLWLGFRKYPKAAEIRSRQWTC